jgi:2-polyprenyl-6-methoxyphenol hydroxylase-like FAD-dependent oxidoreductase
MRKILIVGAGQAGLQLALGLQRDGYDVTVMSARTSDEIRGGRVMSTQCMFGEALAMERADTGTDLWTNSGHRIDGIGVSVPGPDGGRAIDWLGRFKEFAQSIDQRVKMADWLELFEQRGGKVVVNAATISDLDGLAGLYDLTVVAAGKGDIVSMFGRDETRSPYSAPQRMLAVTYVHGVDRRPEHPDIAAVRMNLVPGAGELFMIPAFTLSGPCDILFWEAIPGGPLDVFREITDPHELTRAILEQIRTHLPWEYDRCSKVELTDPRATLSGGYAPVVRQPFAVLPSGRRVMGLADVVVANDPITGQGSNNASRAAHTLLSAIRDRGDQPFDEGFMRAAFDAYWARVEVCTTWTNAMLAPPPPHVLEIIGAAGQFQEIADRFANAFSSPDDFATWLLNPDGAKAYLAEVAARA